MYIKRSMFDKVFVNTGSIQSDEYLHPLDNSLLKILFNDSIIKFDTQNKIDFMDDKISLCVKLILNPPTSEPSIILVTEYSETGDLIKISLPGGHVDDMHIPLKDNISVISCNIVREFCEEYYGSRIAQFKFENLKDPSNLQLSLCELGIVNPRLDMDKLYYMYTPGIINSFTIYVNVDFDDMSDILFNRSIVLSESEFSLGLRRKDTLMQISKSESKPVSDIRYNKYSYILSAIFKLK